MNLPPILVIAVVAILGLLAALLLTRDQHSSRLASRIAGLKPVTTRHNASRPTLSMLEKVTRQVGEAVRTSAVLSPKTLADLEGTLLASGLKPATVAPLFIGAKVLLLFALPALAIVAAQANGADGSITTLAAMAAAAIGLIAPDSAIRSWRTRHLKAVDGALPDALDLLVICAEAGLALDNAIERVASEMRTSHPALASEFALTGSELRVLADRRTALVNMGERTGIEALRRLGATLAQTIRYGTPLTQALRVLAAEMRTERLTKFEEKAARLPVLLTLPMVLFILPTVFLIVGGPAVLRALGSVSNQ